jgi:hypothetical protein
MQGNTAVETSNANPSRIARIAVSLPDRLLIIGLALFLAVSIAVVVNVFQIWLVLPLFAVALIALWRFMPERMQVTRASVLSSWASLLIAVAFVGGNVKYVSQWLHATRDPGLYQLGGLWLAKSGTVAIDLNPAQKLAEGISGFGVSLGNFAPDSTGVLHLQGGDLLPGLIAVMTWFTGLRGSLVTNLLLAALALVAMYALGRRVLGPVWALVPQVALGLSVAFMFLARGPYSEMIMVTVAAAGLIWLISAVRRYRTSDFVMSGVFLGAATLSRIDGLIATVGVLLVFALAALGLVDRERRPALLKGLGWFALGAAATTGLGFADLLVHKAAYLTGHWSQTRSLIAAAVGVLVVATILAVVLRKITPRIDSRATRTTAVVLSSLVGAVMIFWLSRPLWYISRWNAGKPSQAIMNLQKSDGLPVDGTRTYDEQTMAWIGWYFGWPLVILAILGFVWLVYRGWRRRSLILLIIAVPPLAAALVYFTRVSITPDQVWAYRRLLPVITPGFLIAGTYVLAEAWKLRKSLAIRIPVAALGVVVAFSPVVTYNSMIVVRDGGNQYSEISSICADIHSKAVLFVRDSAPANYALTLKTVCNVDVVSAFFSDITQAKLAELDSRDPGMDVVIYNLAAAPGANSLQPDPAAVVSIPNWPHDLDHIPDEPRVENRTAWVGELSTAGLVVPED